jgi:hypothetical protein
MYQLYQEIRDDRRYLLYKCLYFRSRSEWTAGAIKNTGARDLDGGVPEETSRKAGANRYFDIPESCFGQRLRPMIDGRCSFSTESGNADNRWSTTLWSSTLPTAESAKYLIQMSKVILVTGANSGIGFELVRLLAKEHTVYLGARNPESGQKAK